MENCIFCKIVKGEVLCKKVYEDKDSIAFLDIEPINIGHTLVVPKKHFKNISEMSSDDLAKISPAITKISKAILKIADGLNINQNNNRIAGQLVEHVHFHLIPRYIDDGSEFHWTHVKVSRKDSEDFLEKIKKFLKT
jgi:histidine triad (HIT) family protein